MADPIESIDPAALDAAIRLMAPIISHEIRNPLAVIGNSAYFVKTKLAILKVSEPKVTKHLATSRPSSGMPTRCWRTCCFTRA